MNFISIMAVALMTVCSSGLLGKMQGKIASMGTVKITVSAQGSSASVVTDGTRYYMKSEMMEVWCDGTDRWIHNAESGEITLTCAETGSPDIFENPASVLTSELLDTYSVVSEQNGSVVLKVKKNLKVSYPQISIKVSSDGLPQVISLKSISGEVFDMKIISIKAVSSVSENSFMPSSELLKKSFVNDLR